MNEQRINPGVVICQDRLFAFTGSDWNRHSNTCECVNLNSYNEWQYIANCKKPRVNCSVSGDDQKGLIWLVGGTKQNKKNTKTIEQYEIKNDA